MFTRSLRFVLLLSTCAILAACSTTRTHLALSPEQNEAGQLVLTNADLRVAASALQSGDTAAAKTLYEELLTQHPDSPPVWLGLGNTYFLDGDFYSASRAYDKAAQLDPGLHEVQLARARVAIRMRNLDEAQMLYTQFLQEQPNHPIALAGLGMVYELRGNSHQAQETFRRGLAAHPGNEALRANLGLSLALSGQAREAVNILLGNSGVAPGSLPQVRDNLALAYGLLGRIDVAKEILSSYQAKSLVEDNLAFYDYLRKQHAKLQQKSAAQPASSTFANN